MAKLVEKAKKVVEEKVENIKKPEAWATDMDLADVSSDAITYIAKVTVKNPYSCPIPICQISYSFKSKGRVIASGTIGDQGSLPSNDTTTLNVPLKVPHGVMVSLVTDIGEDWDIDYELDLGITIDLPVFGGFTIPIHTQGVIKLPTLSNLWNAEEYFHSEGETKFPSLSEIGKSNLP